MASIKSVRRFAFGLPEDHPGRYQSWLTHPDCMDLDTTTCEVEPGSGCIQWIEWEVEFRLEGAAL